LFVRNIGWDTTQDDFKEHMEQFGALDYAVLCKATIRDITPEDTNQKDAKSKDKSKSKQDVITHKGTGFVRFQSAADAKTLYDLSQSLEQQLNQERI